MDVDYKALQFWLAAGNTIGLLMVSVYSWLSNRHKVNASAIEVIKDSMGKDRTNTEARFARVEGDLKRALTHDDLEAVYERMNAMASSLSSLEGHFGQMSQTVHMIHEFLLNQGNRK